MDADSPYVQNARYTSTVGKSAVKWKQNVTTKATRKILQYSAFLHKEGSVSENDVILLYLDLCLIT